MAVVAAAVSAPTSASTGEYTSMGASQGAENVSFQTEERLLAVDPPTLNSRVTRIRGQDDLHTQPRESTKPAARKGRSRAVWVVPSSTLLPHENQQTEDFLRSAAAGVHTGGKSSPIEYPCSVAEKVR